MATPIQYVPQYVPTSQDVGMLSNFLDKRQAEYDVGYSMPLMFEDQFAQIGVSPENIEGKNVLLGNFQDRISKIVDRYGGDYGAAAKDIAREITREKQNPFYQLAGQHSEAMERQQALKDQYGAYALPIQEVPSQFIDPEGNLIKNINLTPNILNQQDLEKVLATEFSGLSKQIREGSLRDVAGRLGMLEASTTRGITENEVEEVASQMLDRLYNMNPDLANAIDSGDPRMQQIAQNMAEQMVGGTTKQFISDPSYAKPSGKTLKYNTAHLIPSTSSYGVAAGKARINTFSRRGKLGVDLISGGESSMNKNINQPVENYNTGTHRNWVFVSTDSDKKYRGGKYREGSLSPGITSVENGTVNGFYKFYEIMEAIPKGEDAKKKFEAKQESDKLEEYYNYGSIATAGKDKEGISSLKSVTDDDNLLLPEIDDQGRNIIITNKGTDKELHFVVSPVNGKVITSTDGRVVVEEVKGEESREAFGPDSGESLTSFTIGEDGRLQNLSYNASASIIQPLYNEVLLGIRVSNPEIYSFVEETMDKALNGESLTEEEQSVFRTVITLVDDAKARKEPGLDFSGKLTRETM